jgi:Protein of unknown function (DUF3617)
MKIILCSALLVAGVYAADAPPMKEGLWSIHTVSVDQPGNKKTDGMRSICRNHAYDERVRAMAAQHAAKSCKTISENSVGGTTTTETQCSVGGSVVRTKATVTFSGDTAHSETHSTYTPAMYGMSETTMVMDQKYVGACPAGVEPGDFIGADGKVTHTARR